VRNTREEISKWNALDLNAKMDRVYNIIIPCGYKNRG
jgi:hypothetical protein